MAYSEDADLVKKRADIMSFGVDSFEDQHDEVARILDRDLKVWYEGEALDRGIDPRETTFDSTLLLNSSTQVKPAAIFLALSLAYDYLSKNTPKQSDGFAAKRDDYYEMFEREWAAQKKAGFDYDWDSSGAIVATEREFTRYRTLKRQ